MASTQPSPSQPRTQAPTAQELMADPVVQHALDQAWNDSLAADPAQRHEEGGWIYLDPASGVITVARASPGSNRFLDLGNPPIFAGCFLVGIFHTHPNPSIDGWQPGPSIRDTIMDDLLGVPDLIRSEQGVHISGPVRRRGDLAGRPGFPS